MEAVQTKFPNVARVRAERLLLFKKANAFMYKLFLEACREGHASSPARNRAEAIFIVQKCWEVITGDKTMPIQMADAIATAAGCPDWTDGQLALMEKAMTGMTK